MQELDIPQAPRVEALARTQGRSFAFLDLETTSPRITSPEFGITEVGVCLVRKEGGWMQFSQLINPGFPVPQKVTKITGISSDMVEGAPAFPFLAERLRFIMENTVVVGFNIRTYDMPGICAQFRRYGLSLPAPGMILDLRDVWMEVQKTKKGKLLEVAAHYGRSFDGAHRALSDVKGCVQVLEAMLESHGENRVLSFMRGFPSLEAPELPPEADRHSQEKQEAQEKAVAHARTVIMLFVEEGHEWDLHFMVERGGLKDEFTASIAVQELLDEGLLLPGQIQLPQVRKWLDAHWQQVLAASQGGKLKPMLEQARKLGAPAILDYTQLRAALKQHELDGVEC